MTKDTRGLARQRSRAGIYRLFALVFDFPTPEIHGAAVRGDLQAVLAAFESDLGTASKPLPRLSGSPGELESSYIATFETGEERRPAVSLRESAYVGVGESDAIREGSGPRAGVMEDLLRFYHHFGLRLTRDPRRRTLPDHLCCELEMLAFLCARDGALPAGGEEAESCRRAQRDFLRRHLERWLPRFGAALERRCSSAARSFYVAAAAALRANVADHVRALR